MLQVITPEEVLRLIRESFTPLSGLEETVGLDRALGRVLARDICAGEYVPGFDRSTVDGYAVRAADTFGCGEAVPAVLALAGQVAMGRGGGDALAPGSCRGIPTGGALPPGADCAVMAEYTEDYGDGTVGVLRPGAPGQNVIFRGDDVYPGKRVFRRGRRLAPQDIGALAAMGVVRVPVARRLRIGVLSTGDELVPPEAAPGPGQVRDVNRPMLCALLEGEGIQAVDWGIAADDETMLLQTVERALRDCDGLWISGGSSVGQKDALCRVLETVGELLFHGVAMKPGKPALLARAGDKPLAGLPGHPAAAYFVARLFLLPLLDRLQGRERAGWTVTARLRENVGANHGRAQYTCVRLEREGGTVWARPLRSKSGLITTLAEADGYFCIDRDCEGMSRGTAVEVTVWTGERCHGL